LRALIAAAIVPVLGIEGEGWVDGGQTMSPWLFLGKVDG
jgi:hypothetical protein